MEKLVKDLLHNRKTDETAYLQELYQKPGKEKNNGPTYPYLKPNVWHMADLLFLPVDRGFAYALVVADVGTRYVDMEPMKDKKSENVIKAMEKIWNRRGGRLKKPMRLSIDQGKEFKGPFIRMLENEGIEVKLAKPGRSRMLSIVERKNQTIGTLVHKLIVRDESVTGSASSAWVKYIRVIVEAINEVVEERQSEMKPIEMDVAPKMTGEILDEGTKVRAVLDKPYRASAGELAGVESVAKGSKVAGRFRSGDIRFDPVVREVEVVMMKPGQPIMYMLNDVKKKGGVEYVGYTKDQLQVVKHSPVVEKSVVAEERYEFEKILDKRKVDGEIWYLIKWKGVAKKNSTWEKRKDIYKDLKMAITRYDKKNP